MIDNLIEWLLNDELPSKQEADFTRNLKAIKSLEGYGNIAKKKGRDRYRDIGMIWNPVPVNGVVGEYFYLNRLRSRKDGSSFLFHRICYCVPISKQPFDIFELVSSSGKEWFDICLSPFSLHRTCAAPLNVKTQTWSRYKYLLNVKKIGFGVRSFIPDFPQELPQRYFDALCDALSGVSESEFPHIKAMYPRLTLDNLSDNASITRMRDKMQKQVDQILSITSTLSDKYQYRNLDNFNRVALNRKDFKLFMAIRGR